MLESPGTWRSNLAHSHSLRWTSKISFFFYLHPTIDTSLPHAWSVMAGVGWRQRRAAPKERRKEPCVTHNLLQSDSSVPSDHFYKMPPESPTSLKGHRNRKFSGLLFCFQARKEYFLIEHRISSPTTLQGQSSYCSETQILSCLTFASNLFMTSSLSGGETN